MAIAPPTEDRGRRIAAIDAVRGVAIVAMVVYHTGFDLSARSLIPVDILRDPAWIVFARSIASTFLLLVGVGLVLANRRGVRPKPYFRRVAIIAAAAALVTLVTWWVEPEAFVFFGILHEIALASVLALPFLRLPAAVVAAVAAGVIALPFFYSNPLFDWPPLWWVGLSTTTPVTVDYVPVFPWFGVVLFGILAGRILVSDFLDAPVARWRPTDFASRAAVWMGRWSLAIYLIHQPVLYGVLWAASPYLKPDETALRRSFMQQCSAATRPELADDAAANLYCGCIYTNIAGTDLLTMRSFADMSPEQRSRWDGILAACRPANGPS